MNMENKIIGYEAELKRIEDIAHVFSNYDNYKEKGIALPKGLILSGPAGVGKTMFARYLAESSNANFLSFDPAHGKDSKNENAHKIKMLFEEASKNTPSIIFIDEINNYVPNDDYRSDRNNDFLATLLKCLDGSGYKGIMVVAACVDADDLPDPLLRSGRMDEHIVLTRPDFECRCKLIEYYLSQVKIKCNVDIRQLGYKINGFVGADIKNLVNMASRIAFRRGEDTILFDDFLDSIYTIKFRDIKRKNSDDDQQVVAFHEIGHLVVGKILQRKSYDVTIDSYDYIKGVTTPSSSDSNDYFFADEGNESKNLDRNSEIKRHLNTVSVLLAGKAAEEVFLKSSSSGCMSDFSKAEDLIWYMFKSGLLGFEYVSLLNTGATFFYSDKYRRILESKAQHILKKAYKTSIKIIKKNKVLFLELYKLLLDKSVLIAEESNPVFEKYGY